MTEHNNYLDVVRHDREDGTHNARVVVRSEHTSDVGATLDVEAAEKLIQDVATAMGWTVAVNDPGAVDSSE
jgi:hypothetical protein